MPEGHTQEKLPKWNLSEPSRIHRSYAKKPDPTKPAKMEPVDSLRNSLCMCLRNHTRESFPKWILWVPQKFPGCPWDHKPKESSRKDRASGIPNATEPDTKELYEALWWRRDSLHPLQR